MRAFPIAILFVALGCKTTAAPEALSPENAVAARLGDRLTEPSSLISEASCQTLSEPTRDLLESTRFQTQYPQGVFVLCGLEGSGDTRKATVYRMIYDVFIGQVRVSEQIDVRLRVHANLWQVIGWDPLEIDYPPPASPPKAAALPNRGVQRTAIRRFAASAPAELESFAALSNA